VFPLTDGDWQAIVLRLALSARESQIARLVLDNVSDDNIAGHLSISPHTVHAHILRLHRKLRVHARHQLIIRLFNAYVLSSALRTNQPMQPQRANPRS
jgi:DNA-binding CsgD family transcriptional regulator